MNNKNKIVNIIFILFFFFVIKETKAYINKHAKIIIITREERAYMKICITNNVYNFFTPSVFLKFK